MFGKRYFEIRERLAEVVYSARSNPAESQLAQNTPPRNDPQIALKIPFKSGLEGFEYISC